MASAPPEKHAAPMPEEEPLMGPTVGFDASQVQATLKYVVHGRPTFASVTVYLNPEESVVADGGSLNWMSGDISTKAFCPGGCGSACQRKWSGESCYMNKYQGPGYATFAFDTPGDILPFALSPGNGWILTQKAFIAGTTNITVSSRFAGCCTTIAASEGGFFTKVTTKDPFAMFFAGGFGEIVRHDIPEGKTLYVDNGMFFAAHQNTRIAIKMLGGVKTAFCSGEGLVMAFVGPAVVFTQSRDPRLWDNQIQVPNHSV